jgi:hypothetical protein
MKKISIVLTAAMATMPVFSASSGNHPMAGCGLGYLLLSNKDNDKFTQIVGATTNGTFGTQTFGISSGTSGCTQDGAVKLAKETEVFAEVNLKSLRRDLAEGRGEFADAFASLIGVPEFHRADLISFLHANYADIFPRPDTDADAMLRAVAVKLSQHHEFFEKA